MGRGVVNSFIVVDGTMHETDTPVVVIAREREARAAATVDLVSRVRRASMPPAPPRRPATRRLLEVVR